MPCYVIWHMFCTCYITCVMLWYIRYVMLCYMTYEQNRTCYITCVMLFDIRYVMLCYITCVKLCYITYVMLCYITCVMLYDILLTGKKNQFPNWELKGLNLIPNKIPTSVMVGKVRLFPMLFLLGIINCQFWKLV